MANNASKKTKKQKSQAVIRIVIMVVILVLANMLAARFHTGIDLTKEKRFTLSPATKNLLHNMEDVAVVTVYLDGKLTPGYERLKEATRERLQTFKEYTSTDIIFDFQDPFEGKTEEEKPKIFEELASKGIFPINLKSNDDDGYAVKFVFPWASVRYKGLETPVKLIETSMGIDNSQGLSNSEALLEYKFAEAINRLSSPEKREIAYIMGHGEALGFNTFDMLTSLRTDYKIDTLDLPNSLYIPSTYKAIIINKPTQTFDDKEKFKIDQYVMNGGHVMWIIDQLNTPMDSLQASQQFISMDYNLNLGDQLFKYGVRVNPELVEDFRAAPLPVMIDQQGDRPQMQLRKWIYFPVFMPEASHPIVKNLDPVMGMFVNTIDTIQNPEIKKTILLSSSNYSRSAPSPVRVSLGMLHYDLDPAMFKGPPSVVAVLLEGKFRSPFQNRLHPRFLKTLKDSLKREFKGISGDDGKMIVVADGDMFQNDFSMKSGPFEMGYWKFTETMFSNKTFFLNCMEYLTDNSGLIEARTKDARLRLLDEQRAKNEETKWQFVNIGIPLAFVLIFASAFIFFRKRKYEHPLVGAQSKSKTK